VLPASKEIILHKVTCSWENKTVKVPAVSYVWEEKEM